MRPNPFAPLVAIAVFLAALSCGASTCRAGGPTEVYGLQPERSPHSLAFRGGDRSHCRSFLLTESAVLVALKADAGQEKKQTVYGSIDLGGMVNVGSRSAVGASGFWESGTNHNRGGVRLRYRRWLGHRTSVELSPGIVLAGNDTYEPPGFIGQAALNAGDILSLVVEGEHAGYQAPTYAYNPTTGYELIGVQHRSDTTFRVGLRGGSYLGLGTSLLAAIGAAAIAATWN